MATVFAWCILQCCLTAIALCLQKIKLFHSLRTTQYAGLLPHAFIISSRNICASSTRNANGLHGDKLRLTRP